MYPNDYWQAHFAPAAEHNASGGYAMYRRCLKCSAHALEGSLSAHASWCDKRVKAVVPFILTAAQIAAVDDTAGLE